MAVIELKVKAVAQSERDGFTVLLTDREEKYVLPITIGSSEAFAIALPLQRVSFPRPFTHDLMLSVCERLGVDLEKVVITDIRENTFFAEVRLRRNDEVVEVLDARPSDAIALAIRAGVPIYMEERLVEFTLDMEDITFGDGMTQGEGLH
jgi:bifunctional DNase/RNase